MGMQATWIHDVTWEGMLRFDRKFVTMDVRVRRRKKSKTLMVARKTKAKFTQVLKNPYIKSGRTLANKIRAMN